MPIYNVCFSSDKDYTEPLAVAITSIIENSKPDENFNFHILDGGISKNNKDRLINLKKFKDFNINFIEMDYQDFDACPMLKDNNEHYCNYHVTKPTYFRFKLPSLLPDLDKILYLDCDIISFDSIKDLYNTEINNYYAGMTNDIASKKESSRLNLTDYYNAGVMLINLTKWREDNIEDKLFEFVKNNKNILLWQDQDAINIVFQNKILNLSSKWNFQISPESSEDHKKLFEKYQEISILHFAGRFKPWLNFSGSTIFELYYNYLGKIGWLDNLYEYKHNFFKYNLKEELYNGLISEELQKVYKYIESKHQDMLDISDMRFSNVENNFFHEQSKIYEYINHNVALIFQKYDKKIEEYNNKLFEQSNHINFLENELKKFEH